MGPGSLLQILFQWCKRAAGLCLRKLGFGPTEAQAFVLQRCVLCCAVLPWPAASSVSPRLLFHTCSVLFSPVLVPYMHLFLPWTSRPQARLWDSAADAAGEIWVGSLKAFLDNWRIQDGKRWTGPQNQQARTGKGCVFSDSVLTQGWVRDLTLSKSHILMQGLETLSPTPDLSSLLTSFKWISLCLWVRLRIMEIIQQRNSTQPTPSPGAKEISAAEPRDLLP